MAIKKPDILIVGCGPGSPEYIPPIVSKSVKEAEVLVGARRLLDLFPDHGAKTVIEMETRVETVLDEMNKARGRLMVVLVSGDPGLSSLAQPIINRFGRESCRVIPGISSIQTAFARLGLDWGQARIIDAHGSDPELELSDVLRSGVKTIAVLGGRKGSLDWLAKAGQDLIGEWVIYICEDLTLPEETIRQIRPESLRRLQASSRTVFLIIKREVL
jgi:cobalt-precorrin-7 (C5)-methyltransferase